MLRYYYKGKNDQIKNHPIHLGGELKQKFIDNINSGEKYYTIEDFQLSDVISEIHEKFKDLSKKELTEIIKFGKNNTRLNSTVVYWGSTYSGLAESNKTPILFL